MAVNELEAGGNRSLIPAKQANYNRAKSELSAQLMEPWDRTSSREAAVNYLRHVVHLIDDGKQWRELEHLPPLWISLVLGREIVRRRNRAYVYLRDNWRYDAIHSQRMPSFSAPESIIELLQFESAIARFMWNDSCIQHLLLNPSSAIPLDPFVPTVERLRRCFVDQYPFQQHFLYDLPTNSDIYSVALLTAARDTALEGVEAWMRSQLNLALPRLLKGLSGDGTPVQAALAERLPAVLVESLSAHPYSKPYASPGNVRRPSLVSRVSNVLSSDGVPPINLGAVESTVDLKVFAESEAFARVRGANFARPTTTRLTERELQVRWLRFTHRLSSSDIGRLLGISSSTARAHLHTAKLKIDST